MTTLRSVALQTLLYALLIVTAIFMMLPFVWMLSTSFKPPSEIFGSPPIIISPNMSLDGYKWVIEELNVFRALRNTFILSLVSTLVALFFCALGGYGFAKYRFPGRGWLFGFLLATMVIPGAVMIVPSYLIMVKLKWINTFWPLIIPGAANAFGIFVMRQYMSSLSDEVLDAARVDGCTEFGLFWRMVVPMCMPGLVTLGLIFFMNSWNNYIGPSIYLKSQELWTLPMVMMQAQGPPGFTYYREWMAIAVISTVPLLIIFLIFQRRFVEGIQAGALAGE